MSPLANATIGLILIFFCTGLGSSFVFFFAKQGHSSTLNEISLGLAGGIMLSASIFSLIIPALDYDISYMPSYAVVAIAILLGGGFLYLIDKLVPHIHPKENQEEGLPVKSVSRTSKMFLAVTIHNIPEGMAVGIAYGLALSMTSEEEASSMAMNALMLAIGIGIQNIPEGFAVALPFLEETGSKKKAFFYGLLSGAVEPLSGLVGLLLSYSLSAIMPWALSFAAGAMIYVIIEEMVPDSSSSPNHHYGVWSFLIAFTLMMVLDNAL